MRRTLSGSFTRLRRAWRIFLARCWFESFGFRVTAADRRAAILARRRFLALVEESAATMDQMTKEMLRLCESMRRACHAFQTLGEVASDRGLTRDASSEHDRRS